MKTTFEYTAARDIFEEPIFISLDDAPADISSVSANGAIFPASAVNGGIIAILSAKKGEALTLEFGTEECGVCNAIVDEKSDTVSLTIDGYDFAKYEYGSVFPKPHFGPINDNAGNSFTRCDRMHREHPHQRSIIVAIGDVNGVDCWNEPDETCGYVRNEEIYDVVSSSAYATFTAKNRWTNHAGELLMREDTRFTVYNQSEKCRTLDIEITFTASFGDVVFGSTKEAGPLGIRLCDSLRSDIGSGILSNSRGGVGENECWGKVAEWCDYHGNIDGIGEMGVTVFDNPSNERYPTAWHIRGYGLFAANNLHFKGGYTISAGESVTYKYRILFRREEMTAAETENRYEEYASH